MFRKNSSDGYKPAVDKITMKTLVHGEKTLMVEFQMQKGALLPCHSHPQEQTGYLVSGRIDLTIGAETFPVWPGDSWCIAGNMEHHALSWKIASPLKSSPQFEPITCLSRRKMSQR
ncbi:Cupin domain-containing protein [Desulfuromusa kysingii]|uniref:Cupin domain-containing protein n=1 Tax=Desulfuromusa kysingii TaxID=37625 RepID=A0A1H4BZZ3_9BACT|nr:cupin domain-containing protein [Desulfuromusa kysingii]SEA53654.1 Cupin domain-containing protein [Desulfuromusa kysingii]